MEPITIQQFIERWEPSGGAERANYQSFLNELCDILEVPRPDPATPNEDKNAYVYDKSVTFHIGDGSHCSRIYRSLQTGLFCSVKPSRVSRSNRRKTPCPRPSRNDTNAARQAPQRGEQRHGTTAMISARGQAEQYARALPATEGRPPFLVIVDIGHSIELYAEFTQTGGTYVPFPDPTTHRLRLQDLTDERHRATLRRVWTDPLALDPASRSARVTQ